MENQNHIRVLGTPVSLVNMDSAIETIVGWVDNRESRYVCAADVHSVMCALECGEHLAVMQHADMVLPDGTPLYWLSRLGGVKGTSRVCGPDLMAQLCAYSAKRGWRHFLLGGADGVVQQLADILPKLYPGIEVCGIHAPSFGQRISKEEDARVLSHLEEAKPNLVWVGLGCPNQERWMHDHVNRLTGAVMIGVGAAFDYHSGRLRRAPLWMRNSGLEWLHRLLSEPSRLWRRYLLMAPKFVMLASWELIRQRLVDVRLFGNSSNRPERK